MSPSPAGVLSREPSLIVVDPSGNRTRVTLAPLPFRIGRQVDNHLVLRDSRASRNHARILYDGSDYYVEDLNSAHGVYVNSARVSRHRLKNSDRIEFGVPDSYSLVFAQEGEDWHRILDHLAPSRSGVSSDLAKLRALVEVARSVQNSLSTQEVLTAVLDAALSITGLERGFLLRQAGTELRVFVGRDKKGATLPTGTFGVPLLSVQKALRQRRELLSMTFDPASENFNPTATLVGEMRSVVCVPLVRVRPTSSDETRVLSTVADTIGVLYLDSRRSPVDLSSGNRELLQTLALEASTIIENARLLEEERIKQRIEEELNIARGIQASLLPRMLPSEGWFRAAGSSLPTHQVGGDSFDVHPVSDDCWSLVVSDVSGKGVSSALLAALLQGAFLFNAEGSIDIAHMLQRINAFLNERTQGEKYATVFYAIVNRDGGVVWANAGHCRPYLVRRSGRLEPLDTTSMPLGMMEEIAISVERSQLAPGDKIVIYSDGVSEAQNLQGRLFESSRMRDVLKKHAQADCRVLHSALVSELQSFTGGLPQADDMTVLVAEYTG